MSTFACYRLLLHSHILSTPRCRCTLRVAGDRTWKFHHQGSVHSHEFRPTVLTQLLGPLGKSMHSESWRPGLKAWPSAHETVTWGTTVSTCAHMFHKRSSEESLAQPVLSLQVSEGQGRLSQLPSNVLDFPLASGNMERRNRLV